MNQLMKANQPMSSLEIAEEAGMSHNDLLKSIRKMEIAWVKVTKGKFSLSEYKDVTGRKQPMYELTKTQSLFVATKFNDEARALLVLRWEALENERVFFVGNNSDPDTKFILAIAKLSQDRRIHTANVLSIDQQIDELTKERTIVMSKIDDLSMAIEAHSAALVVNPIAELEKLEG